MTAAWVLALTAALAGQATAPGREVIAEVRVHGNHIASNDAVIEQAGIVMGAPFGPETIDAIRRRLEATGAYRDVEVLKRFASIADPSLIVIVIVVNEGPVRLAILGDPDEPVGVVRRRGFRNLMFMPIFDAEDGYGLTYGVRLARPDTFVKGGRLSFPLTWGGMKRAGVEFDRVFAAGPVSRLAVGGAVQRQRNPAFEADDDRRRVWLRAERHVWRVRGGATAGWQRVSFLGDTDTLRTVSADLTLDTRLNPLMPRNAVYASASVERIAFEQGPQTRRTRLDGRVYVGLIGQSVFVLRAVREDADRPLPPYLQSLLGGWSNLRGFKAGSFVGDTLVAGSAELRVPLTSTLSIGKIGVSVFVDSGTAYGKGEKFASGRLKTGLGASVWFTATVFQMSLSVAHGRGASTRVNFGGGITF